MRDLEKLRSEQMNDPEFREYALEMEPLAALSKALIGARLERNLTQKELAAITGIPQGEISRMESCKKSPSLRTLQRIAAGLDMQLKIELVPREDQV